MHTLTTDGPIFSSCTCVATSTSSDGTSPDDYCSSTVPFLFTGSHDAHVYCWNRNWELLWKAKLDSQVYSTPFLYRRRLQDDTINHQPQQTQTQSTCTKLTKPTTRFSISDATEPSTISFWTCLCVCSTSGTLYLLDPATGRQCGSHKLPGDVFSSPVVLDDTIVVGCRDDFVHCIEFQLLQFDS